MDSRGYQQLLARIHQSKNPFWLPIRFSLLISSKIFTFFAVRRVRQYQQGKKEVYSPKAPVISVGNLSVGGTGKTPVVAYLLDYFSTKKVVVLARGYKAGPQAKNDEVLLLERDFPSSTCLVGANRVENCKRAEKELYPSLFILDDGFQHLKLSRILDIVLIDALMPNCLAKTLPAGFLREPPTALKRADLIMLTHSDQVSKEILSEWQSWIQRHTTSPICFASHRILHWRDLNGKIYPLESFKEKEMMACCAIGNPGGFQKTLEGLAVKLADFFVFPDHYHYTEEDVKKMFNCNPKLPLVTTGKDIVKLRQFLEKEIFEGKDILEAVLKLEILQGEEIFHQIIEEKSKIESKTAPK